MAKFIMRELSEQMHASRRQRYPHLLKTGEITLKEMAEDISQGNTFTPGEVMGVVRTVADRIARYTARGLTVRIDGFGTFRARLAVNKNVEEETAGSRTHRTAKSVRIGGMRFRADKDMVHEANRWARLERRLPRGGQTAPMDEAQRMAALRNHLETHPYIRLGDYCELTGLKRTAAYRELRRLREQDAAWIKTEGTGTHKVYVLRREEE